ncbi:MAG: DNA-binding protein [Chloroflexi bacterium]|nr:DNA-binding protein [Chloroflexota bacterium]MDL1944107.1 HEPN domain-containing protein [Chloroflexi bacterium CFX2]
MSAKEYKKALVLHRLERARTTLADAQTLYKTGGSTASIVNRAYYSMFYAALALLAAVDRETSKHTGVLALFDQLFVKTKILPKEMSKMLRAAFDARQTGDYEDSALLSMEAAGEILGFAEEFVESTEKRLLRGDIT